MRIRYEKTIRWFETASPDGEEVLMLRQGPRQWHGFYSYEATASGGSPKDALTGGLGDAIDTDRQLRRYCDLVLAAPRRLSEKYGGLYAAQGQCHAQYYQI